MMPRPKIVLMPIDVPPNIATAKAYSLISQTMAGQSAMLAYVDIISIGSIVILCLVPLVFIMKRPSNNAPPAAAHPQSPSHPWRFRDSRRTPSSR